MLFNIDDIGPVKFDMRFVVLLHAVDPLKISIYRKFLLRFSNKYVSDAVIVNFLFANYLIGQR